METKPEQEPQLWVVDRQEYWRTLSVEALHHAGFSSVRAYTDYPEVLTAPLGSTPDLVLFGCATSRQEERTVLREMVRRGCRVVVFVSSLSLDDLRDLFHAGAMDVVERPRTAAHLLSIVGADLAASTKMRDGL